MNETWAQMSDLAFEAALAGYVVALVCYAVELASRAGVRAGAGVGRSAAGARRHLDRDGPGSTATRSGQIGARASPSSVGRAVRPRRGRRDRRRASLANVVSIVARGLAVGRLPLGNMYEFTSR